MSTHPAASAARRSTRTAWIAYGVLLVVYVALGVVLKSVVLNWIVGPLFPVVLLAVVPRLLGRPAVSAGGEADR